MVAMGPLPTASSRRGSNNSSNRPPIGGGASSSMNQPSNSANTAVVEGIHSLPNTHSSAPSSKHKKHSGSRHPTTSTANIHNSAAHYSSLLARGWTGRNALPSALNPLRGDEIEKDVRHMQAYGQAAEAYQMQLYLQMNGTVPRHHAHQDMIMMNAAAANAATSNGQAPPLHHPAAVHHGHGSATTTTTTSGGLALPVRIDPEEEKRLFVLRKKIAVAEQFREQAEQEWVAHQAHYVHMAARLRQAQTQRAATTQLLQTCLQNKASVLAQARLRLQMTRDVYAALQTRQGRLMEETADNAAMAVDGGSTTNNNKNNSSGTAPSDADAEDVLTELWALAEEDYKRACTALVNGTNTSGENNNSKDGKTAGGGKKKKSSGQQQSSVISWEGTHLTMTPTDVPLLVSVLSNVPDKTVAYGGDPKNMIWLPHHLKKRYLSSSSNTNNRGEAMEEDGTSARPSLDKDKLDLGFMIDDKDDNQNDDEDDDEFIANDENHPHNSRNQHHFTDQALQQRVAELQDELKRERTLNQEWSAKIAASRKSNDEWVSMMSLVRQETEALLHRHNILLESDQALAASEQLHAQEMKEQQEAEAAAAAAKEQEGPDEEETDAKQEETPTTDKVAPPTVPALPSGLSALDALTAAAEQSESLPTPDDAPKGGRKTSSKVNTTTAAEEAANDGDDEGGSGGEDPPEDDWAATTTTSVEAGKKRNNGSTAETGTAEEENAAKRRKVE